MKNLLFLLPAIVFTACNYSPDTEKVKKITGQMEDPVKQASNNKEVEIMIHADDNMRFDKTEIDVEEGQHVKVILKHVGKATVDAIGHNLVILASGTDFNAFAHAAIDAEDNNYIPKAMEHAVIAKTGMIGGGETTVMEFVAPPTGTYDFLCSFPGHYLYMRGKLVVHR